MKIVDFRSSYIDILYTKMILGLIPTFWGWSQTSMADDADVRDTNVFLATIMSLGDPLISQYYIIK